MPFLFHLNCIGVKVFQLKYILHMLRWEVPIIAVMQDGLGSPQLLLLWPVRFLPFHLYCFSSVHSGIYLGSCFKCADAWWPFLPECDLRTSHGPCNPNDHFHGVCFPTEMSTEDEEEKLIYEAVLNHFNSCRVEISHAITHTFPFLHGLRDRGLITDRMFQVSEVHCVTTWCTSSHLIYALIFQIQFQVTTSDRQVFL